MSVAATTIAIIVVASDAVTPGVSAIYAAAREAIEANTALDVAPLETLPLKSQELRTCAGDGSCYAARLEQRGMQVDLLLTIAANPVARNTIVGVRLIGPSGVQIASTGGKVPADDAVDAAVARMLPTVFSRDLWGRIASISVAGAEAGGEVRVAERSCVTPCTVGRLFPGTYEVNVNKSGFEAWRTSVTLAPRQDVRLTPELVKLPDAGFVGSTWFWVVVGAGTAAVAGTAIALAATANRGSPVICVAPSAADCR